MSEQELKERLGENYSAFLYWMKDTDQEPTILDIEMFEREIIGVK